MIRTQQTVDNLAAYVMGGAPVHFFHARRIVTLLNVSNRGENLDLDAIRPTVAINTRESFEQGGVAGFVNDLHMESCR